MSNYQKFYINGQWVAPCQANDFAVINPATEQAVETISLGSAQDVDLAVAAAKEAFASWGLTSVESRACLLERIIKIYQSRSEEIAQAMTLEMGAPISFSRDVQTPCGDGLLLGTLEAMRDLSFASPSPRGGSTLCYEPIGVCGLITPWNWPMNQVVAKVAPALAAGCTIVLKPSELSPLSAIIFAEILDEAGVPAGVFNLVNGDGPTVGAAMSAHPDIDMISFTGSTRAGITVTKAAANTVKRVALELGGKSPNLLFSDADIEAATRISVDGCFGNSGQSCDAPTRLLVERSVYDQVVELAAGIASDYAVSDPQQEGEHLGPVVSQAQYNKIQGLIQAGIDEGAKLVAGGVGRPEGLEQGYYVRPTVFADVNNEMVIAQEEVFGPVLSIIPFDSEDQAIAIANDTPYGLAAYIQSGDPERVQRVARRLRAGAVSVNGAGADFDSPFGGYKQSGNGRENGFCGLHDFLEIKTITC